MLKASDLLLFLAAGAAVIGAAVWLKRRQVPVAQSVGGVLTAAGAALAAQGRAPVGSAEVNARAARQFLYPSGSPTLGAGNDLVIEGIGGPIVISAHSDGWRVPIAYPGTLD